MQTIYYIYSPKSYKSRVVNYSVRHSMAISGRNNVKVAFYSTSNKLFSVRVKMSQRCILQNFGFQNEGLSLREITGRTNRSPNVGPNYLRKPRGIWDTQIIYMN